MNPSTIITYVKFRGDISFKKQPYNEADALAFSIISYLNFTGVLSGCEFLSEAAEKYKKHKLSKGAYEPEEKEILLYEMAKAKRYSKVKVENCIWEMSDEKDMTYYSITFHISPFRTVVAFPGTDKTLRSWKENFTFLYKENAPGLEKAKDYLTDVLKHRFQKVEVVGHSKGGAAAVYASMNAEERLQKRIKAIYLFDAPGFINDLRKDAGYQRIVPVIRSYRPEDSVIGRLFIVPYPTPTIIKTDAIQFTAHELLHWCIGPDGIERGASYTDFSEVMSQQLNALVMNVEPEKRSIVVDEMFDLFFHRGITELTQVKDLKITEGMKVLWDYRGLSPETKLIVRKLIKVIRSL